MNVVAEGVEDEATMSLLIEYGCDEAQGYYFSRPVQGDELLQWLETSPFGLPPRLGDELPEVDTLPSWGARTSRSTKPSAGRDRIVTAR